MILSGTKVSFWYLKVPISIDNFWEKIQTLFQFLWVVVVFYLKVCNCSSLKISYIIAQARLAEMGVIVLMKEFFHTQTYISESKHLNIFTIFY